MDKPVRTGELVSEMHIHGIRKYERKGKCMDKPVWTGELVSKMHIHGIRKAELAEKLGCTRASVTMILNGTRAPSDAQSRYETAVDAIIAERKQV